MAEYRAKRHPSIKPLHPGELLREDVIPALGKSKTEIARLLGISRQALYDILNEKSPVTAEMAVKIGKLCGNGPALARLRSLARANVGSTFPGSPTLQAAE